MASIFPIVPSLVLLVRFCFHIGMVIPSWGEVGMGKIPHSSLKAHFNSSCKSQFFPTRGLQLWWKKSHHSWLRHSWWNFFHHACWPICGEKLWLVWELKCAFRDSWGIINSTTRGFATRGGISHPHSSSWRDWVIVLPLLRNFSALIPILEALTLQ